MPKEISGMRDNLTDTLENPIIDRFVRNYIYDMLASGLSCKEKLCVEVTTSPGIQPAIGAIWAQREDTYLVCIDILDIIALVYDPGVHRIHGNPMAYSDFRYREDE